MKFKEYCKRYMQEFKPAKDRWNYEDGCVLSGAILLYDITGEDSYKKFVLDYMNYFIGEDGTIRGYKKDDYNIDNINTGKAIFFAYDQTKEEKYRLAFEQLMDQLRTHPRTNSKNFWHKKIYPNQIWLDGLYMAQPFYMTYDTRYNDGKNHSDIINQFKNVRKYIYDQEKCLYYHAYDEAKIQPWANKETGLSSNFWLRAMGWYLMSLIDTMDEMPEKNEDYKVLGDLLQEAVTGILKYQDPKSKLFYQLIDKPEVEGNYLETSGTAMIANVILKACVMDVLPKETYRDKGEEILLALCKEKLVEEGDKIILKDICSVAGLGPGTDRDGSVAYYLSEPIVQDEHKAVGVLMMAYGQWLRLKQMDKEEIGAFI